MLKSKPTNTQIKNHKYRPYAQIKSEPTPQILNHFGISDLGISKNLSRDEDDDDDEFLRRRSTAALLQNSTHLGVLAPADLAWFRLLHEKLDDESADFSLTYLCLLRIWGSSNLELQNRDLRLKKSDRSKPQQKIRFSSMKKIGFPLTKKIRIRLWRNVGLLLGEGERRKEKEKEKGEREKEKVVGA